MKELQTWGGKSSFKYEGSVATGTTIKFGLGNGVEISGSQFKQLLNNFESQTVDIGTSRTVPPEGSVGKWLMQHITKTATASYVGAILLSEGYAKKNGCLITFIEKTG